MGSEALEFFACDNTFRYEPKRITMEESDDLPINDGSWFEEEIDVDLKWSFALNRYIYINKPFISDLHSDSSVYI